MAKYKLVSQFLGYVSKYDITNIKEGFLVTGSKNVRINTTGRAGIRKGYTLDGQTSNSIPGVKSSFDFEMAIGQSRHLRSGDGKLQFRYVANAGDKYLTNTFTAGQVYWIDLMSGLTTAQDKFNYTSWWEFAQGQQYALFVNGTSNIYEWSGGHAVLSARTANTLTKSGTTTWAEAGFYFTGTNTVLINGTSYTYTGGAATTTLTGVTPSPIAEPLNSVVVQGVKTTANSAMTSIPTAFKNNIVAVLKNQLYISSTDTNSVYVSKVNNYKDFAFTAVRLVGEGALFSFLDGVPTALIAQESDMYISAGKDFWYKTTFTLSSDLSKESLTVDRLKTSVNQSAISQTAVFNTKNSVLFLNNETSLDELGRVENILGAPQAVNYSDSIKDDFDSYDFTDASGVYWKYNLYIAVPKSGVVLIYNIANGWWEAPQTLPVGSFSIIDGELYGHDYNTFRSYKLFTGTNDNGFPIYATAKFSYQNYGDRANAKQMTEQYVEGYIAGNTILNCRANYEIDGCLVQQSGTVDGSKAPFVCLISTNASLGSNPIGEAPLGGGDANLSTLPPKFRKFITNPPYEFYEVQFQFDTTSKDAVWEVLAFGGNVINSQWNNSTLTE